MNIDLPSAIGISLVILITFQVSISQNPDMRYLFFSCLLLFLFFVFKNSADSLRTLSWSFVLLTLLTAIVHICNLQLFSGVFFLKNGSAINTGENANYFASVIPFIFSLLLEKKDKLYSKIFFVLTMATFVLCTYVLFTCHARTATIATILGIGIVLSRIDAFRTIAVQKASTIGRKLLLISIITVICWLSGRALYNRNPDSVDGRFFIYEVSWQMIKSKPIFGHGPESFRTNYNIYQSNYIKAHNISLSKKQLANDNYFAFNEFITVFVELGAIGLIIVGLIIFSFFRTRKSIANDQYYHVHIGALGGLVSILTCALFSYPFHTLSVMINVVFFGAIVSGNSKSMFFINPGKAASIFLYSAGLCLLFVFSIKEYRRVIALDSWENGAHIAVVADMDHADPFYKKAREELLNKSDFLYNYGAELYRAGDYEQSLSLLKRASLFMSTTDLYIYLGNNYKVINDFKNAESCYQTAEFMHPAKFSPKFQLLLLYQDFGFKNKALSMAKKIADYPVKIPSITIDSYKSYSREFLNINRVN
ncbi:O-antigen ligase family protein [Pedobacter borealis]|uniref:O-antigen ligase family protein n=1 Tax=Pedobacter borealis TaxID=475254 RepID=UPI001428BF5D|nr:O-antigen ligase family protein [Pedobacter borealis]